MTDKEKDFLHGLVIAAACAALPVRKRMPIAWSYNGVVLPKLPELDDEKKKKYPYIAVVRPVLGLITVCFAAKPAYYNTTQLGGCIDFEVGTEMIQYNWGGNFGGDENRWVYVVTNPTIWDEESSYREGVWTNTDIYKDDGTLYLAASDPIPLYKIVGYSYNGIVLPKLPEWDKEEYPYAVIFQAKTSGTTYCVATSEPLIIKVAYCGGGASVGVAKLSTQINKNSLWDDFAEDEDAVLGTSYMNFVWSNYDVYNDSEVLKLVASEPIPVYE